MNLKKENDSVQRLALGNIVILYNRFIIRWFYYETKIKINEFRSDRASAF